MREGREGARERGRKKDKMRKEEERRQGETEATWNRREMTNGLL